MSVFRFDQIIGSLSLRSTTRIPTKLSDVSMIFTFSLLFLLSSPINKSSPMMRIVWARKNRKRQKYRKCLVKTLVLRASEVFFYTNLITTIMKSGKFIITKVKIVMTRTSNLSLCFVSNFSTQMMVITIMITTASQYHFIRPSRGWKGFLIERYTSMKMTLLTSKFKNLP